jgi:hypothetical protein
VPSMRHALPSARARSCSPLRTGATVSGPSAHAAPRDSSQPRAWSRQACRNRMPARAERAGERIGHLQAGAAGALGTSAAV